MHTHTHVQGVIQTDRETDSETGRWERRGVRANVRGGAVRWNARGGGDERGREQTAEADDERGREQTTEVADE